MLNDYLAILGAVVGILGLVPITYHWVKRYAASRDVVNNPWVYYVLALNLVLTTALPISLALEFDAGDSEVAYKSFRFYCEHYPHIVVYPALLFGFAGLFTLRAAVLRWAFARKPIVLRLVIAIIGACFALYYEATGGYLMLFEFNKEAQSATEQFQSPTVQRKLATLGLVDAFNPPMAEQVSKAIDEASGRSQIGKTLKSYASWSRLDTEWRSKSRTAYLIMFWYMLFVMLFGFSLLPTRAVLNESDRRVDSMISLNLAGAFAIFLMWTPFRIYYNHQTKIPIFGPDLADNFFGRLPNITLFGISPSEATPFVAILLFVYFLLLRAGDLTRSAALVVLSLTGSVLVVGSAVLAALYPDAFRAIYGLEGEVKFLVFRVVIIFLVVLLTYDYLSSRVDASSTETKAPERGEGGA